MSDDAWMWEDPDDEDEFGDDFDCHLDPTTGLCGAAGSEDCEFECPHRPARDRIRARVVAGGKGSTGGGRAMTDKFLPGPWFVSRDGREGMEWNNHIASVEHPHLEVCSMFHTNDKDGNETGEANARLVAAAPDMLEALRCLLPGLVLDMRYAREDDDTDALLSRVRTVEEAIAKATVPSRDSEQ